MKVPFNRMLVAYSAVLTTVLAGVVVTQAVSGPAKASFDEIDVKRINLREEDGTLRMVITNTARTPGLIIKGKDHPHPNRKTAGILFFNDEGTENGGLTFGGKKGPDGKVQGGGHISFDQYEQDQVIQLTQSEYDGKRWAAMVVNDRPEKPVDMALAARIPEIQAMPAGPAKDAEMKKVQEVFGGKQRVYVGKTRDRESAVLLADAEGRARMMLMVKPDGAASIQFLDETGKVVKTIAP